MFHTLSSRIPVYQELDLIKKDWCTISTIYKCCHHVLTPELKHLWSITEIYIEVQIKPNHWDRKFRDILYGVS